MSDDGYPGCSDRAYRRRGGRASPLDLHAVRAGIHERQRDSDRLIDVGRDVRRWNIRDDVSAPRRSADCRGVPAHVGELRRVFRWKTQYEEPERVADEQNIDASVLRESGKGSIVDRNDGKTLTFPCADTSRAETV